MGEAIEELICPITLALPVEPVIAEDGHIYERSAIERQFEHRHKSPMTNEPIGGRLLAVKHVTNILESFIRSGVVDDRLAEWKHARTELFLDSVLKNLLARGARAIVLLSAIPMPLRKKMLVAHVRRCSTCEKCRICTRIRNKIVKHRRACSAPSEHRNAS